MELTESSCRISRASKRALYGRRFVPRRPGGTCFFERGLVIQWSIEKPMICSFFEKTYLPNTTAGNRSCPSRKRSRFSLPPLSLSTLLYTDVQIIFCTHKLVRPAGMARSDRGVSQEKKP